MPTHIGKLAPVKVKKGSPNGNSRAAQNRKIRRDALRDELKAREYIRQLHRIADHLDPNAKEAYLAEQVPMVKARADIYHRLLDKCLPSLRPVDLPISMSGGKTLTEQGQSVLTAMAAGEITPSEAAALMQAITAQARIIELDELDRRVATLEAASHGR
jgi:hypothetical protein